MRSVDAFAAKARFPALLDLVARGEEVLITRHGKAVARLVPAGTTGFATLAERLKLARRGAELGNVCWRELRDTGRR